MDPITAIGAVAGLVGGVADIIGSGRRKRELKRIRASNPMYKENALAKERLGMAENLLNARMPGYASAERNIYTNQANTLANVNRNATDASQALALAGGVQANTNQAFENLGMQQANDYYRRLGNLNEAQQGMINEQDKVYQDQIRRWESNAGISGAIEQNRSNAWHSLSNLGFSMMNMGGMGAFGLGGQGGGMGGGQGGGMPMMGGGQGGGMSFDPKMLSQLLMTGGMI